MKSEEAYRIMDEIECGRYSHECEEYARIVVYQGHYWLALYDGVNDQLLDRIDDSWNVIGAEAEIWA